MSSAAPTERPTLCVDCEEAPARRLLDKRWVCERCNTEAALAADKAKRGPEPPAERAKPDEKMWHVGTYSGSFRCVQTNQRGTQMLECGVRHPELEEAQEHADKLNAAMGTYVPVRSECAAHRNIPGSRGKHAAWRVGGDAAQCPLCETARYVRSLLLQLPEINGNRWDELNEWEQGFVTSVRSQDAAGHVMTDRQVEHIEKLYRRLNDEPDPV